MSIYTNPYAPPRAARQTVTFRAGAQFPRICFGCGKPDVEPREVDFTHGRRSVRAAIPLCDGCLRRWESVGRVRAGLVLVACAMLGVGIYLAPEAPPNFAADLGFATALGIAVSWLMYLPPWRLRVLSIAGDDVTLAGVNTTASAVPLREVLFSRLMSWPLWLRRLGGVVIVAVWVGAALALWCWLAPREPPVPGVQPNPSAEGERR